MTPAAEEIQLPDSLTKRKAWNAVGSNSAGDCLASAAIGLA